MQHRPKGWYPDPIHVGVIRWWDAEWTPYVRWGDYSYVDKMPLEKVAAAAAAADAAVVRDYLEGAAQRQVITNADLRRLLVDLGGPEAEPAPAPIAVRPTVTHPPVTHPPVARPTVTRPPEALKPFTAPKPKPVAAPTPVVAPKPVDLPPPLEAPAFAQAAAPPAKPSAWSTWWDGFSTSFRSDMAVHGLAYLGVVLLFAGVFGLIAFSFGDVARELRLVALVAAPASFFLAAWFLGRRGARAVGSALTVLGGAILPVAVIASITDGAPPDIHGTALPITQAVLCGLIAAVEWAMVSRVPALRWVIAPTAWLGVGVLLGVTRDPVPTGEQVVRAGALQIAGMVVAIAVTLLWARHRTRSEVARAAMTLGLPIAIALTILETMVAATEGWPALSGAMAAVAAIVIVECSSRLGDWIIPLQSGLLVLAGARLAHDLRPEWVAFGVVVAALGLAEWVGARRSTPADVALLPLIVALVSAAMAMTVPEAGFAAATVVTVWATFRRLVPPAWLRWSDPDGIVAGLGTLAMTTMLVRWIDPSVVLMVVASVVALVAIAARVVPVVGRDRMCRWWTSTASAALVLATVALPWDRSHHTMTATIVVAALGAVSLVIARTSVILRAWATAATVLWGLNAIAALVSASTATQAVVLAALAAAAVLLGAIVDRTAPAHLAAIGHLGSVAAVVVAGRPGTDLTTVLAVGAATWCVLVLMQELWRVAHIERALRWARTAVEDNTDDELVASAVCSLTVVLAAAWTTACAMLQLPPASAWLLVPVGCAGAVLALGTLVPWRRASAQLLAWVSYAAVLVGVTGPAAHQGHRWPQIVALALVLLATTVIHRRHVLFAWSAWAVTAPLSLLLLQELADVRPRWNELVLTAWAAVLLVGAAVVDRVRGGPAGPFDWWRTPSLRPLYTLGSFAFLGFGIPAMAGEQGWGWILLAMSGVAMTVAVLHPSPPLAVPALVAALFAGSELVPWTQHHPWSLSLAVWVLLAAARVAWRRGRPVEDRWDLAPFVAAHVVAAAALALAPIRGSFTATYLIVAMASVAIAVVLRDVRWSSIYGAIGYGLVFTTAVHDGPGWMALAFLVSGLALLAGGLVWHPGGRSPISQLLFAASAAMFGAAWASMAVWLDLAVRTTFVATALGGTTVVLACAVALRASWWPRDLYEVWALAGLVAPAVAVTMVGGQQGVGTRFGAWIYAGVFLGLAVATAVAARAVHPILRWCAVGSLWASLFVASIGADLGRRDMVLGSTVVAICVAVMLLPLHVWRARSPWLMPFVALMIAVQAVGLKALDPARPREMSLVLLLVAAELAVVALVSEDDYLFLLPVFPALAAWFVLTADSLHGEPHWYTMPVGLAILVEVGIIRWVRRDRPGATYSAEVNGVLVFLELGAMTVMAAPFLVSIVSRQLWWAVPSIVLATTITIWGSATKVRRRAEFGVADLLVTLVLLIGVPIARAVPNMSGAALWLTVAGLGAVAIVVATTLEQSRAQVRRWAEALEEATHDWETSANADTAPHRDAGGDAGHRSGKSPTPFAHP